MKGQKVLFSKKSDEWQTPQDLFDEPFYNTEVRFIKGRLKFGDSKNSAPFPSMIVIFRFN